jgi:hypothetical protein
LDIFELGYYLCLGRPGPPCFLCSWNDRHPPPCPVIGWDGVWRTFCPGLACSHDLPDLWYNFRLEPLCLIGKLFFNFKR